MGSASSCLSSAVAPLNPSSSEEDGDQGLLEKLASQPALLSKPVPGLSLLLGGVAQTWVHVACERKQVQVVRRMCQFLSTSSMATVREALGPYCRRMSLPLPESPEEGLRLAMGMCNGRGQTPLMHACYAGCSELVKLLLSKGADPWAADRCGCRTALHYAAIAGCVGCVAALMQSAPAQQPSSYGIRYVDNRSLSGLTALHYAVYYDRHEVLRELLRHGPDINAATSCSSYDIWLDCDAASTPLHFAAARGNSVGVQELLRYYASRRHTGEVSDPRLARNSSGRQPWHLAATQYPALRYLAVVLQPGQPLTRVVGGDDGSQTTSLGAPSLAAIAAAALRQKLLASVSAAEAELAAASAADGTVGGRCHSPGQDAAAAATASNRDSGSGATNGGRGGMHAFTSGLAERFRRRASATAVLALAPAAPPRTPSPPSSRFAPSRTTAALSPTCHARANAGGRQPSAASRTQQLLPVQQSCHSLPELGSQQQHPFGVQSDSESDRDLDPGLPRAGAAARALAGPAGARVLNQEAATCSAPDLTALRDPGGTQDPGGVSGGSLAARRCRHSSSPRQGGDVASGPLLSEAGPDWGAGLGPGTPTLHRCTTSPPGGFQSGGDVAGASCGRVPSRPEAAARQGCLSPRLCPPRVVHTVNGYFPNARSAAADDPGNNDSAGSVKDDGRCGTNAGSALDGPKQLTCAAQATPRAGGPDGVSAPTRGSFARRVAGGAGALSGPSDDGEEPDTTCSVCFARRKAVAPVGCGHGLCAACARELCHGVTARPLLCPFCRQPVTGFARSTAAAKATATQGAAAVVAGGAAGMSVAVDTGPVAVPLSQMSPVPQAQTSPERNLTALGEVRR